MLRSHRCFCILCFALGLALAAAFFLLAPSSAIAQPAQKKGPHGGPFFVASLDREEIIHIPGTGMISTTSIHAPGIW